MEIWSIKIDDPDKQVPGRIWTTEATLGHDGSAEVKIGVRLIASTTEKTLDVDPHVPGFFLQLLREHDVLIGTLPVSGRPAVINSEADIFYLENLLQDRARSLPIIVVSGDERKFDKTEPIIDVEDLSRATAGLARIFLLPADFTYRLTDRFGKIRSVFHGAARLYWPNFSETSDPFEHPLYTGKKLSEQNSRDLCLREMKSLVARASLLRVKMDKDVFSYSNIRSLSLKTEREKLVRENANDARLVESALIEIQLLEEARQSQMESEKMLLDLHDEAEQRALGAEAQLRGSFLRIHHLLEKLSSPDRKENPDPAPPDRWAGFAEWVDVHLSGKVALSPQARRGLRSPQFSDPSQVARCLLWLADECRNTRMNGVITLKDHYIEEGIRNSPCGGDKYTFDYQGRRLQADWHIKNGGNTRNPGRCLRIYYAWDEQAQIIVVSNLPAHRDTAAS